eukprot:g1982.t1
MRIANQVLAVYSIRVPQLIARIFDTVEWINGQTTKSISMCGAGMTAFRWFLGALLLSLGAVCCLSAATARPAVRAGVWSWACGYAGYAGSKPDGYYVDRCFDQVLVAPPPWLRGWFQLIYWRDLETAEGVYDWSVFDRNLTKAAKNGLQLQPVLYIFDGANPMPEWMSNVSRPIKFHRGGTTGGLEEAPNFLDPAFQGRWQRTIKAFATHLSELPDSLRKSIWAVQAVAGITGDNRPWNGVPADPADDISPSDWMAYSRKIADMYIDAFTPLGIPVIANLHDGFSGQQDQGWFLQRAYAKGMRGAAVKEGGVTHWYQENGERLLWQDESPLLLTPQPDGSFSRARGELAVEPDPTNGTYGNWAASPWWSLQATAEWCLTFGVDAWNLYAGFLGNETFAPTMEFFNRHAGQKDVSTATAAFISFRDALDTADVTRWPVEQYGPVNSTKSAATAAEYANSTRMLKIAAEHAARGAQLPKAMVGAASSKNGVKQKKAMALIDVCWECYRANGGNYGRYLQQLDPLGSSVGWWQLGPRDQPYGRFARGLEHNSSRTTIRIQLDPLFGAAEVKSGRSGQAARALVRVVYFDRGIGAWQLGQDGAAVSSVRKQDTQTWQVSETNVTLGQGQGRGAGNNGTLLTLSSLDGEDDVFSILEVLLWQ